MPGKPKTTALIIVLAGLAVMLGGCGGQPSATGVASSVETPTPTPMPTPTPVPEYQAEWDLAVGDCFDPIADSDDQTLLAALMRACDEPHLMEVIGLPTLDDPLDAPYPGEADLDPRTEDACISAFSEYVGVEFEDSRLGAAYYNPSRESWATGDRGILCVVESSVASPLTRSVEGSEL